MMHKVPEAQKQFINESCFCDICPAKKTIHVYHLPFKFLVVYRFIIYYFCLSAGGHCKIRRSQQRGSDTH